MSQLDVKNVSMTFSAKDKSSFLALTDICLTVKTSEFVTLIGHSGCGKSTLLNLVGGLLMPTGGTIECNEKSVKGPGPERAMVFQSHALLPWMTCLENVHLAVRQVFRTCSPSELKDRAKDALRLVHLEHAMNKFPSEISGGMKQRVGIARALVVRPSVLLLDEPFGALDALTRANLQDELMKIIEASRATVVMVTHDIDEALLLSDRIVMMTNGPAATIGEILENKLTKPRDRMELATNPVYADYRQHLLRFLYEKQRHLTVDA